MTDEHINKFRKETNALIKKTFKTPLRGKPYEPFRFTVKRLSIGDFVEFRDDQSIANECYCRKMNCLPFYDQMKKIAEKYNIMKSGGIHWDPARLEADGKLDCDLWLREREYKSTTQS